MKEKTKNKITMVTILLGVAVIITRFVWYAIENGVDLSFIR